jgi:transcriptional regulator with XRE-family HTH domain
MDYYNNFLTNLKQLMKAKNINKFTLAKLSGLSTAIVNEFINGSRQNITLKSMIALADTLAVPLPLLLHDPNGEIWEMAKSCSAIAPAFSSSKLSGGYERVTAVLTPFHAYKVKQWSEVASIAANAKED